MTVRVFGSINLDQIYRVPHLVAPGETLSSRSLTTVLGGKGANQSVALARAGAKVSHLGRIGRSDSHWLATLEEAGVDTDGIERVDAVSGHAIIQVNDEGENAIVLHGGANRGFDRGAIAQLLSNAQRGDWLLMQNECDGLEFAFAIAIERGLRIAFNPAPMHDSVRDLPLDAVELLIVNETEAAMLSGQPADDPLETIDAALAAVCPAATRVLTLGARGAHLVSGPCEGERAGDSFDMKPDAVAVVDTTGAGDTFVGFLLAAIVAGESPAQALRRAVTASAIAVTVAGATPSIPTAAVVNDVMTSAGE